VSERIAAGHDPINAGAASGTGWERMPDPGPMNPRYGEPLPAHGMLRDDPIASGTVHPDTGRLVADPGAPYGRNTDGTPLTKEQYEQRYVEHGADNWDHYPPNAGAAPGSIIRYHDVEAFIHDYGPHLDRIGDDRGKYLGLRPDGIPASFEQRSLPIASLDQPYHQYQLTGHLPDGWRIEISEVAPGFGRTGGGIQLRVLNTDMNPVRVKEAELEGVLR